MTADYIARLVEHKFDQIAPKNKKSVDQFNRACMLLEENIRINFFEFEETDLVRKWAKDLCELRTQYSIWYRSTGWLYGTRAEAGEYFPNGAYFIAAPYYVELRKKRKKS